MSAPEVVIQKSVIPTFDYTWTYEMRKGDDKIKSVLKYTDNFNGWDRRVPLEGSVHPDIAGLYLVDIKAAREEGMVIAVTLGYESAAWNVDYPGRRARDTSQERYWVEPSLSEEPLLSFHKAAALTSAQRDALNEYQSSSRSAADYAKALAAMSGSTAGIEFLNALQKGQDGWRAKQYIWCRRRTVKTLSSIPFDKIGKIDAPPKDSNGHPATEEGFDWMYLSPDIQDSEDGTTYSVVEKWQRSYEGGWNPFFYSTETPAP